MAVLRPLMLVSGAKRSTSPLQVPGAGRGGVSDGRITWFFTAPVTCKTPLHTWTLTPFVPALLWDIVNQVPTDNTFLDILNHAHIIFCLDNQDGLYAVQQESWAQVVVSGDICPLAWVDPQHDLTPRLLGPVSGVGLFVWQTGTTLTANYGTFTTGTLAYPTVSGPIPNPTGAGIVTITSNRIATLGIGAMIILETGNLAYLATPTDPTTAVLVEFPDFTAPGAPRRCIGINGNAATGEWWALVQYDKHPPNQYGQLILQSSVEAAVNATDWSLVYTAEDMSVPHSTTTPVYGIGPNGETLVSPQQTGMQYWHIAGGAVHMEPTTWIPQLSIRFLNAMFGTGDTVPFTSPATRGTMVDPTGALDAAPASIACFDFDTYTYYAVFHDGSLQARHGPLGTAWVSLAPAMAALVPFQALALSLQSDGTIAFAYGAHHQVFLAIYTPGTGTVATSAGRPAVTYETTDPLGGDTFGCAAFMTNPVAIP